MGDIVVFHCIVAVVVYCYRVYSFAVFIFREFLGPSLGGTITELTDFQTSSMVMHLGNVLLTF